MESIQSILAKHLLICDLTLCANRNNARYASNKPTKAYRFHLINKNNYAVTLILTDKNCLLARGKTINDIDKMLEFIDSLES
jgi:hypothetical protein